MRSSERDSRRRVLRAICVTLYLAFVAITPLAHHDLACHFKTPQHCTACSPSSLGSSPHAPTMPGAWLLVDAGLAVADAASASGTTVRLGPAGRSPPTV